MKILVTGGTGVIGAGLLPELLLAGHEIVLLSRGAKRKSERYPERVVPFAADVADASGLRGAAEGCDAVIHIAGIVDESPPDLTFEKVNVSGTRNLLEEAQRAGADRFIFMSSLGSDRGTSAYHQSKLRAEEFVRRSELQWTIARPGNVYGPGDEVISMLLKLVRSLPAVPLVGWGDQRFQPVWFENLGRAIAQLVVKPDMAGETLELAGPEITTTREVMEKLKDITGRSSVALPVPIALAKAAVRAVEKFDSIDSLLERSGLSRPISTSKLQMLLEENFIAPPGKNALMELLGAGPTPLDDGLRLLADQLPELLPDEGVGAMERKHFEVEMTESPFDAAGLMKEIRENIAELMPVEFDAEPGSGATVKQGGTVTGAIPGRGHFQMRAAEVAPREMTFVTVEGHPLAGTVLLRTEDIRPQGVRFILQADARAANVLDWVAMRTIGSRMQTANWREFTERVVAMSGGVPKHGIKETSEALSDEAAMGVARRAEELANT